jgi:hypothetical protein
MDDTEEVDRVAAEFLERHGPSVILDLRERAEIAAANEDQLSAEAWTISQMRRSASYGGAADACGAPPPNALLSRSKMSCIGAA